MAAGEVRAVLANAHWYMQLMGHTTIAWMWLWQAEAVLRRNLPGSEANFRAGKLAACRFFFQTELPQIELAARLVSEADRSALDMPIEGFSDE